VVDARTQRTASGQYGMSAASTGVSLGGTPGQDGTFIASRLTDLASTQRKFHASLLSWLRAVSQPSTQRLTRSVCQTLIIHRGY